MVPPPRAPLPGTLRLLGTGLVLATCLHSAVAPPSFDWRTLFRARTTAPLSPGNTSGTPRVPGCPRGSTRASCAGAVGLLLPLPLLFPRRHLSSSPTLQGQHSVIVRRDKPPPMVCPGEYPLKYTWREGDTCRRVFRRLHFEYPKEVEEINRPLSGFLCARARAGSTLCYGYPVGLAQGALAPGPAVSLGPAPGPAPSPAQTGNPSPPLVLLPPPPGRRPRPPGGSSCGPGGSLRVSCSPKTSWYSAGQLVQQFRCVVPNLGSVVAGSVRLSCSNWEPQRAWGITPDCALPGAIPAKGIHVFVYQTVVGPAEFAIQSYSTVPPGGPCSPIPGGGGSGVIRLACGYKTGWYSGGQKVSQYRCIVANLGRVRVGRVKLRCTDFYPERMWIIDSACMVTNSIPPRGSTTFVYQTTYGPATFSVKSYITLP